MQSLGSTQRLSTTLWHLSNLLSCLHRFLIGVAVAGVAIDEQLRIQQLNIDM
jgi:hypothetical protein